MPYCTLFLVTLRNTHKEGNKHVEDVRTKVVTLYGILTEARSWVDDVGKASLLPAKLQMYWVESNHCAAADGNIIATNALLN